MPESYHTPVLLSESIDGLSIRSGGVYVDVTFGGGGHSHEILRRMDSTCRLFAFDQDEDAFGNVPSDERLTFVRGNFRYLKNWMRYYGIDRLDGVLADLGVSSHHFDDASRGFSFRFDAPLDMRMNRRSGRTAADVVNELDERRLADVLHLYGELHQSRRLASAIVAARPLKTTGDLQKAVEPLLGHEKLAQVFQALRIEVNHEMEALSEMLSAATELLGDGGRLSVITYHSLEDRMVKNVMRSGRIDGRTEQDFFGRTLSPFRQVSGKPIVPSADEQERNPRSRSAKLRVAERVRETDD